MATTSDESIFSTCNDSSATPGTEVIDFQTQTSRTSLLTFNEDRTVTVRGTLKCASELEFQIDGGRELLMSLDKNGTKRFELRYNSTDNVAILTTPGTNDDDIWLRSANDVNVHIDFDDDATEQMFELHDRTTLGAPILFFSMGWSGFGGSTGLKHQGNERWVALHNGVNNEVEYRVGHQDAANDSRRGTIELYHDDSSGSERAGILELKAEDDSSYYLWVDADGKLRIHDSNPTSDTAGEVVGDQT